jgi:hypothetical protein
MTRSIEYFYELETKLSVKIQIMHFDLNWQLRNGPANTKCQAITTYERKVERYHRLLSWCIDAIETLEHGQMMEQIDKLEEAMNG